MPPQFQIGVELTNVFPIAAVVTAGFAAALSYARDLRKSGSDLVVENDLAVIFGRGKINPELLDRFKGEVLREVSIKPLYPGCEINLACGPGLTVNNAIASEDRYYLSSVVQLSMLAWFHDRTALASAIKECIAERFRQNFPGSNPDPGFEGIEGTLRAVSSQTSAFQWGHAARAVEEKLRTFYPGYLSPPTTRHNLTRLTPSTLLGAMDMLYLIQSLPNDRRMLVKKSDGLITIVIWAHFILSLDVAIRGLPGGELTFGQGAAQVIILWDPNVNSKDDAEICLLDAKIEILWTIEPKTLNMRKIAGEERQTLRNYGTICLQRRLNRRVSIEDEDPLYREIVNYTTALAIHASGRLYRSGNKADEVNEPSLLLATERWRIISAVRVLFEDIGVDMQAVESQVERGWEANSLDAFPRPASLDNLQGDRFIDDNGPALSTILILIFSNVSDIKSCADLPLSLDLGNLTCRDSFRSLWYQQDRISLREDDIFHALAMLMIGVRYIDELETNKGERLYVVSDFGWSLALDVIGDKDPADIKPWLFHIHRGVPTNGVTGERKYQLKDFGQDSYGLTSKPMLAIYNRGQSFIPRCVTSVTHRIEYFTSRGDAFLSSIRLAAKDAVEEGMVKQIQYQDNFVDGSDIEVNLTYRSLHRCLWTAAVTPKCEHSVKSLPVARLGHGVATTNAFHWGNERGRGNRADGELERICVVLAKDDKRSRCIALYQTCFCLERRVILRGRDTCEDCAIDMAKSSPGKWIVII